ncbi:hypothetical protein WJX72_003554 [[Myrmecia] bisecta]|uniref:Uncharacterized protein n=1 Tax=[Myrmecia] bisecta TaxID=41462 RepID=A0AAW1P6V1_9CHLO
MWSLGRHPAVCGRPRARKDCDSVEVTADRRDAAVACQQQALPGAAGQAVTHSENLAEVNIASLLPLRRLVPTHSGTQSNLKYL